MDHNELVTLSADFIRKCLREKLPPGTAVYLFGSRARGEAGFASDFDLLIDADLNDQQVAGIRQEFEDSFIPFKVDIVLKTQLEGRFGKEVMKDTVRWL